MDLWIVLGGWDYEGEEVIGVYDNEALANEVSEKEYNKGGYNYVNVEKVLLNERVI